MELDCIDSARQYRRFYSVVGTLVFATKKHGRNTVLFMLIDHAMTSDWINFNHFFG